MSNWFHELFATPKPIIGMVHFPPLPGTPLYNSSQGMEKIVRSVGADLAALQEGGIDAVMFGNEGDRPYLTSVGPETVAAMAYAIGKVKDDIDVPFGVDVLWDPAAAIALAAATGARFVREIFTGVYASDMGLWNPQAGEALRYRRELGADDVKLLFNINAEFAAPLDTRSLSQIAKSVVFSSLADVVCVSGPMTGEEADLQHVQAVKDSIDPTPVFANTGVRLHNVPDVLAVADGAVVGTSLKREGVTWNPVDPERVKRFMETVREVRGS